MNTVAASKNDPALDYEWLMAHAEKRKNTHLFAVLIAAQLDGHGVLPACLGLGSNVFEILIRAHFPGVTNRFWPEGIQVQKTDDRFLERDDLIKLISSYRSGEDVSECWVASIITDACMGQNHLWQDLGLVNRKQLSELIQTNFPELFALNSNDMKWKKFLYKQLCLEEGIYVCRAPSCEVCADYDDCFGPED